MDLKFLQGTYSAYQKLVEGKQVNEGTFYLCDTEQEESKKIRLFLGETEITADTQVQEIVEQFQNTVGYTTELTTSDKTNIVKAINSIITLIGGISVNEDLGGNTILEVLQSLKDKAEKDESSLKVTVEDTTNDSETLYRQYTVKQGSEAVAATIDIEKIKLEKGSGDSGATTYILKQGESQIGVIDIPKDLVVKSGQVVVVTDNNKQEYDDQEPGTYIQLILKNDENTKIYINVETLVDNYTAKNEGKDITIEISKDREISANIGAGKVTEEKIATGAVTHDKLAANAVETTNIKDGAVTAEKLAEEYLAVDDIKTGNDNGTIAVNGTDVPVKGLGTAAYQNENAFDNAGAAENAKTEAINSAKTYTDSLWVWDNFPEV